MTWRARPDVHGGWYSTHLLAKEETFSKQLFGKHTRVGAAVGALLSGPVCVCVGSESGTWPVLPSALLLPRQRLSVLIWSFLGLCMEMCQTYCLLPLALCGLLTPLLTEVCSLAPCIPANRGACLVSGGMGCRPQRLVPQSTCWSSRRSTVQFGFAFHPSFGRVSQMAWFCPLRFLGLQCQFTWQAGRPAGRPAVAHVRHFFRFPFLPTDVV